MHAPPPAIQLFVRLCHQFHRLPQAERCPYLELVEVVDLPDAQYPRYQPLVTGWNQPFALEDCEVHLF